MQTAQPALHMQYGMTRVLLERPISFLFKKQLVQQTFLMELSRYTLEVLRFCVHTKASLLEQAHACCQQLPPKILHLHIAHMRPIPAQCFNSTSS